jgi:hypothetical protein
VLGFAKTFAKQPLEPVSTDGPGNLFTRNSKAQAWILTRLSSYQDRYAGIGTAKIILEYLLKFAGAR